MTTTQDDHTRDLDALRMLRLDDATPAAGARDAARAQLTERIDAAAMKGAGAPTMTKRPGTARRRTALALAAIAITAGGVGIGLGGGGTSPTPSGDTTGIVSVLAGVPTASAEASLRAAAAAAVGQPTVPFRAGTTWVVRADRSELLIGGKGGLIGSGNGDDRFAVVLSTTGTSTTTYSARVNVTNRQEGPLRFTSKASEDGYEQAGRPSLFRGGSYPVIYGAEGESKPFEFGRELLSYQDLLDLPTEPTALAAKVRAAAIGPDVGDPSGDTDFARLRVIADLMTRAPLPADLRGALWKVAAGLDGVRLIGPTKDPEGREGIGITIAQGGERAEIVFSEATGMILSDWIYRTTAVTTCERDLAPCGAADTKAPDGKPWRVLAAPGTVAMGRTVLSAKVVQGG